MAQWYRITVDFEYGNGSGASRLVCDRLGAKAAKEQMDISVKWVLARNHFVLGARMDPIAADERQK